MCVDGLMESKVGHDDDAVYSALRALFEKTDEYSKKVASLQAPASGETPTPKGTTAGRKKKRSYRSNSRIAALKRALPKGFRVSRALDFGCAEGRITGEVANEFSLGPENAFGCDIRPVGESPTSGEENGQISARRSIKTTTHSAGVGSGVNARVSGGSGVTAGLL